MSNISDGTNQDQGNESGKNKRKIIIASAVGVAAAIICIVAFFGLGKSSIKANAGNKAEETAKNVETKDTGTAELPSSAEPKAPTESTAPTEPTPDVDGEFCNDNGYIGDAVQVDDNVATTVRYTTIRTNTDMLEKLIKDTITSYASDISTVEKSDTTFASVMAVLENADAKSIDRTGTFVSIDGTSESPIDTKNENADGYTATTLSYLSVAGSIGSDLFAVNDGTDGNAKVEFTPGRYRENELFCGYFVADEAYKIDVDKITGWNIKSNAGDTQFNASGLEGDTANLYDINFIVKFTDGNKTKWTANIGNKNNKYVVLDISKDVVNETKANIKNGGKAWTQTDNKNVDKKDTHKTNQNEPDANVAVGGDGDDGVVDDGSGDDGVGADGIDHGPEGDKPGYAYVPGVGYIVDEQGGINCTGSQGPQGGGSIGSMN